MLGSQIELPTILLIDDDLVSREVTATLLTLSGFTVHTADSGQASLRLLSGGLCDPGVVLMDVQMPGLSGTALIGELRAKCRRASIYVVSGSPPAQEVVAVADGFLLKPFGAEALHGLLAGHSAQGRRSLDADAPVISPATLAQFRQMMPEPAVREIYSTVATDLSDRIAALCQAIACGDAAEIRRIGHAIKGGCGMAGLEEAARLGALLETTPDAGQDNHLDDSTPLLADLRAAAQRLQRMLDAEFPA